MNYHRYIRDIKWYRFLVPKENIKALFSDYPRSTLMNKCVICWDYPEDSDKSVRLYTVFQSFLDFAKFFLKLPQHLRSFYEIVLGENYQKIHFDLDIETTESAKNIDKQIFNDLINAIVNILLEKNIKIDLARDVCVYTSHGENKKSYHIVINRYCHANNQEAKAFYFAVMEKLPKEYFENKWIDQAVYSKTQQFRTYGSCKLGTKRFKCLQKEWKFNDYKVTHIFEEQIEDSDHEFLICLEESLITARTSNCKVIPGFEIPEQYVKNKNRWEQVENIDKDLAWEAVQLLAHKMGTTPDNPRFPYRIDNLNGSIISLKRVHPSKCKVCKRIHNNENPYILIVPETKHVFFHCRRAPPDQKLYIGCLNIEDEDEEEEKVEDNKKPISVNWTEEKLKRLKKLASKAQNKKPEKKKEVEECKEAIMKNMMQK